MRLAASPAAATKHISAACHAISTAQHRISARASAIEAAPSMSTHPEQLWASIVERYDHAQAAQAATLTDTVTEVVEDGGVKFVLKVAATLREKPAAPANPAGSGRRKEEERSEWRNPFLPPDPRLFVQHLSPTHSLVLNKFNVVPHHALVVTREFQRQEDPLTAADFEATWAVMQAMPHGGLAYFNCGPASGASQPHKHLQVVPLPLLPPPATEAQDPPFWPVLAAATSGAAAWRAVVEPSLPFACMVARLDPATASGEVLAGTCSQLMQRMAAFVAQKRAAADGAERGNGVASHNLVLTLDYMMVVPRWQESDGPVSCNAMAFAGSFFVRSAEEVAYVRRAGPMHILGRVGYPSPQWVT